MDTSTGNIYGIIGEDFMDEGGQQAKIDAVRAKFMKLIPEQYLGKLQGMNRKDRREFYRLHKKEFSKIKAVRRVSAG